MDNKDSDTDSSDNEDWKEALNETRVDYHWLQYNPQAFFPLEEHFYRTGNISKMTASDTQPPTSWTPHFLIGCGRSGSTIIGKILSAHPEICFLNEPRNVWLQVFPNLDVWSCLANEREGRLKPPPSTNPLDSSQISKLFYAITEMLNRPVLLEKTPENTFRLEWLNALFPHSKFIMVKRNPVQTARSISRFQPDTWFGFEEYKWVQLRKVLRHFTSVFRLPQEFLDHSEGCVFAKALLEWALITLSAEEFKLRLSREDREKRFFELHLESMIRNPGSVLPQLLKFLGVKEDSAPLEVARELLHRDQTFTAAADNLGEQRLKSNITEEDLLRMAGPDMRNLIFQHAFHS